jgi:hypothetical protein
VGEGTLANPKKSIVALVMLALPAAPVCAQDGVGFVFANTRQVNQVCFPYGEAGCSAVEAAVTGAHGVALGDVNGDSHLDAVFANVDVPNRVCFGNGFGGFSCGDIDAENPISRDVALGDVNLDGNLDAVFANPFEQDWLCLGDGTGAFSCSSFGPDDADSWAVALGDVNGDGYLDALIASNGGDNQVCLGNGSTFSCSGFGSAGPTQDVAAGDVDNDGNLDCVFVNAEAIDIPGYAEVCRGDGSGHFSCVSASVDANSPISVALGDINRDGILDAVFGAFDAQNQACLGNGTGDFNSFACSEISPETNRSVGVAVGDVDGDGRLDAVFANSLSQVNRYCRGDGDGGFECEDVGSDAFDTQYVAIGNLIGEVQAEAIPSLSTAGVVLFILVLAWFGAERIRRTNRRFGETSIR